MPPNTGNPLSASSLTSFMYSSLPKDADPHLRNPFDALALLCHACMLAVGFRLIGLGEDHKIEADSEAADTKPLPEEWNASKSSDYAFRYAHSQSSLQFLIKVSRLGGKAVINGLGLGDDKVYTFDIPIKDYFSESSFPFKSTDGEQAAQMLQNLFISPARINDLASLLKLQIIQKLAPGLQKEGYEESSGQAQREPAPGREREEPRHNPLREDHLPPYAQPRPFADPLAAGPRRPYPAGDFPPPDFEDEYEINRPGRGGLGGERRPLNIGERDLYPQGLGPNDPFRSGGFGGLGGIGGGGMHPTFDDPIFGGDGGAGIGGFDGRAPPGARYDPVGPGDGPPNLRGGPQFPGGFGRGGPGGGPPNPFGGFGSNDFI